MTGADIKQTDHFSRMTRTFCVLVVVIFLEDYFTALFDWPLISLTIVVSILLVYGIVKFVRRGFRFSELKK
jgi:hypothetical protein